MSVIFSALCIGSGLINDAIEHNRDIEPKNMPKRYTDVKKNSDAVIARQRLEYEKRTGQKCHGKNSIQNMTSHRKTISGGFCNI